MTTMIKQVKFALARRSASLHLCIVLVEARASDSASVCQDRGC
jgi:hypothetical protein